MRAALAAALFLCACKPVSENPANQIVHSGDPAVLTHPSWQTVPVAIEKGSAHELNQAAESNNRAAVEDLERRGKVFEVPVNTEVRVTGQSFNERHVEIASGPHAGKSGWVPFEWLRLVPR